MFLMQAARLNRQEIVDALRRGITENDQSMWWEGLAALILALAILGLVLQGISMWKRRRQDPPVVRDDGKLFQELLSGLRLAANEQRILRQLVKETRIEHPAVLLMSSRIFDETVQHWGRAKGGEQLERKQSQLQKVRAHLFADEQGWEFSTMTELDS